MVYGSSRKSTPCKSETRFTMDSNAQIYAAFIWDRWERLRRHPDYILFCHKYKENFDLVGDIRIAGMKFQDDPEANTALEGIKKDFNLDTVYFYLNNFSPPDLLGFPPIFNHDFAIDAGTVKRTSSGEYLFSFVTSEASPEIIECRIDTSRPKQEISSELSAIIKHARTELYGKEKRWSGERPKTVKNPALQSWQVDRDGQIVCNLDISLCRSIGQILDEIPQLVRKKPIRKRLEENKLTLRVYDLRIKKKLRFHIIARQCNIKPAAAYKKFSRAKKLIHSMSNHPPKLSGPEAFFIINGQWGEIAPGKKQREQSMSDRTLSQVYG